MGPRKLTFDAVAATVFVLAGKADFYGWAEFVKWIFGIYAAGNVGEHVSKKVNVTPAPSTYEE